MNETNHYERSILVLSMMAKMLIISIIPVGLYKGRSVWTLLELTIVAILYTTNKPIMTIYLMSKLVSSFIHYILTLTEETIKDKKEIFYLQGFKSDKFHAGILVKPGFMHYKKNDGIATTNIDSIWRLVPDFRKNPPPSLIRLFCGYHIDINDVDNYLKKLPVSGRCHDYATSTIYHISLTKYLSSTILFIIRWEFWIIQMVSILVSMYMFTNYFMFEHTGLFSLVENIIMIMDFQLLLIVLVDMFNIDKSLISTNRLSSNRKIGWDIMIFLTTILISVLSLSIPHITLLIVPLYYLLILVVNIYLGNGKDIIRYYDRIIKYKIYGKEIHEIDFKDN